MSSWFIFAIATVLVQYFRFASLGYDKSLILAGYHVPLISTLVYDATQATILMTNLELVLGLRHIVTAGYQGHGALPRASLPRIFGLVIFAVVMVKSIGRFAANEVLVMGGYYVDGYEHAARAGLILSFLIYLALFLSAIFVLIHAGRTPRVFETRQVRRPLHPDPVNCRTFLTPLGRSILFLLSCPAWHFFMRSSKSSSPESTTLGRSPVPTSTPPLTLSLSQLF